MRSLTRLNRAEMGTFFINNLQVGSGHRSSSSHSSMAPLMARSHAWLYRSATRGACRAMIAWLWRDRVYSLHVIRVFMLTCATIDTWPACANRKGALLLTLTRPIGGPFPRDQPTSSSHYRDLPLITAWRESSVFPETLSWPWQPRPPSMFNVQHLHSLTSVVRTVVAKYRQQLLSPRTHLWLQVFQLRTSWRAVRRIPPFHKNR